MNDDPLSDSRASKPRASSSWKFAFTAPWIAVLCPRLAGSLIATAPMWAVAASAIAHVAVITLVVLALNIWHETTTYEWDSQGWRLMCLERSIASIWQEWHSEGLGGPLGEILLVLPFSIVIGLIAMAIVQLSNVHARGKASTGFSRAFKAGTASLGPFCAITTLFCITYVFVKDLRSYQSSSGGYDDFQLLILMMACGLLYLNLADRIARGARAPDDWSILPPMCEGCGYDLSHKPDTGRCPECGAEIENFLEPDSKRRDPKLHVGLLGYEWRYTVGQALMEHDKLYARVRVRNEDDRMLTSFIRHNYWLVSIVASVWACCLRICFCGPYVPDPVEVCVFVCPVVLLGCWGLHRAVVSLVFLFHLWRKTMPYPGFAQTVLACESAFLWTFLLLNGSIWTIIAKLNFALAVYLPAIPGTGGIPLIVLIFLGGNIALLIIWFRRVHRALLAVRWSNF